MDELLSPVSRTYYKGSGSGQPLLQEVSESQHLTPATSTTEASSSGDLVEILSNQPDYETVVSTLGLLAKDNQSLKGFNIASSGPAAAKVIQILVTEITPNYWTLLKESAAEQGRQDVDLLLDALRNLAGVNALLLRIRQHIQEMNGEAPDIKRPDVLLNLDIYLEVLAATLDGDERVSDMWMAMSNGKDHLRQRILSKELVTVLGGGRVVSLSAEGASLISQEFKAKKVWTSDGVEYSRWLARNILTWSKRKNETENSHLLASLLSKSMSLGYTNAIIQTMILKLIDTPQEGGSIRTVLSGLPTSQQRTFLFGMIQNLSDLYLNGFDGPDTPAPQAIISGVAGFIKQLVADDPRCTSHLEAWLTNATGAGLGDAVGIRRAILAVLATTQDSIAAVFEKSLAQFGDYLYIRHTPILQQEVHAQVLLLSAGYLQRLSPFKLAMQVKSSAFMNMVSKRLEASQTRARLLGMIVGEALSEVVEKSDKRLDFKMDETKSEEALRYKSLIDVYDVVDSVDPLRPTQKQKVSRAEVQRQTPNTKPRPKPPVPTSTAKAIIEEIDSDEEMDDDLIPLSKPDDDEEDSDDDPEVVRRDRPRAPVYIRTLITYLRDTENYDRQKLALTTAPTLIRRKANFGTEVKEHAEDLATLLVGLQDKFEIDDFDDLKLQGMIAIAVAQPQKMGPWFGKTVFDGDFSVAQRVSVLAVLGLGARELAGIITSGYAPAASFPSKMLPDRMKRLYVDDATADNSLPSSSTLKALPPNALDTISKALTTELMAPIAANAADATTGPDVLKLSTFTSRLQSNKDAVSKSKTKPRVRAIPNTTAQLLATSFFFPLTARFQSAIHSSTSRARGIIFQPILLSLYLKTLALLLHAAGPSTLSLPDMTSELWGILLGSSIRAHAVGDLGVTKAVLFALLTLLDVNTDRMRDIYQSMSREVIETQEWVMQVFQGLRGEDGSGEEAEVKALAAGCLIRLNEGSEKYRMLLMGNLIG
ncbi:telomere length regulation protein-domain-containing protein [Coniella lustricola]|uniref:Telomere length regulation protein-domain-containing protein n=1 Tax=Coniella lustricola TaxID=2025994 RepID=A0A2T3A4H9_9PEZI|nr:telomere length regulation protein-domain-containing protein [Coniella lustricola]